MRKSKNAAILILIIIGIGVFGYAQYIAASNIDAVITQSEFVKEDEYSTTYNVELLFSNSSLLVLTIGASEFVVIENGDVVGKGQLEPFVLSPWGSNTTKGTFQMNTGWNHDDTTQLKISGQIKYDVWFTVVEIPFVFYPTEEQTREFIDAN